MSYFVIDGREMRERIGALLRIRDQVGISVDPLAPEPRGPSGDHHFSYVVDRQPDILTGSSTFNRGQVHH